MIETHLLPLTRHFFKTPTWRTCPGCSTPKKFFEKPKQSQQAFDWWWTQHLPIRHIKNWHRNVFVILRLQFHKTMKDNTVTGFQCWHHHICNYSTSKCLLDYKPWGMYKLMWVRLCRCTFHWQHEFSMKSKWLWGACRHPEASRELYLPTSCLSHHPVHEHCSSPAHTVVLVIKTYLGGRPCVREQ